MTTVPTTSRSRAPGTGGAGPDGETGRGSVAGVPPPPRHWPDSSALRREGFAPIGAYAALGDGRSVALVAADGAVDWWALPTMDSPPVFGALLDPGGGGHVVLAPDEPAKVDRRYVDRTNVLETIYTTDAGVVRVTDSVNVGENGLLPWSEMGRRIEGVDGEARRHGRRRAA